MRKKIVIAGPAYPYRGGIAVFIERLARQFIEEGHEVSIVTFTLQYPSILFPGRTQYSGEQAPKDLSIVRRINSVNPLNWLKLGRRICREAPDILVFKFWLPYMSPCFGTIARLARKNGKTRVVAILDNLIPHEKRPGDMLLARYFCDSVDKFIAMSHSVCSDIDRFDSSKPHIYTPHPLYDNFGSPLPREEAAVRLSLDPSDRILLFFGLIRDYKGLDLLIEAFASLGERKGVKLVVAGEFYSDGEKYHELARRLGVDDEIVWRTEFVPDSEVRYYFCAADLVVQPYRSATQSGITQIAYHFGKPMLVTCVGGLPEIVPDGRAGYVVEPTAASIAAGISDFLEKSPDFSEGLKTEKEKYSWAEFSSKIL